MKNGLSILAILLLGMSEEQLYDYIAPLWAMAMWGNKHYQIDNVIEVYSLVRPSFLIVLGYGQSLPFIFQTMATERV